MNIFGTNSQRSFIEHSTFKKTRMRIFSNFSKRINLVNQFNLFLLQFEKYHQKFTIYYNL